MIQLSGRNSKDKAISLMERQGTQISPIIKRVLLIINVILEKPAK